MVLWRQGRHVSWSSKCPIAARSWREWSHRGWSWRRWSERRSGCSPFPLNFPCPYPLPRPCPLPCPLTALSFFFCSFSSSLSFYLCSFSSFYFSSSASSFFLFSSSNIPTYRISSNRPRAVYSFQAYKPCANKSRARSIRGAVYFLHLQFCNFLECMRLPLRCSLCPTQSLFVIVKTLTRNNMNW